MAKFLNTSGYRGAIALNNMGVSLLERGAHRQALSTFKDAILVMKLVMSQNELEVAALPASSKVNVQILVDNAAKRLAKPHFNDCALPIEILSVDSWALSSATTCLRGQLRSNRFLAIRIEPFDSETGDSELESSILLFNFGAAHLYSKAATKCSASDDRLHDSSAKLFNMAFSIVTGKEQFSVLSLDDIESMSEARLFMAAATLQSYTHLLIQSGKPIEAVEAYQEVLRLGGVLRDFTDQEAVVATAA